LKYDAASGYEAPRVTAKGEDEVAFSMRRIAEENDVPVVENRPVARGLYANTNVGDIIPEEYFRIIADIYAHVMNLHKRL
ncbi:EscU/YscU/HrcU family type III secretion system export apparatus switch protein, partial [Treponema socranskii]